MSLKRAWKKVGGTVKTLTGFENFIESKKKIAKDYYKDNQEPVIYNMDTGEITADELYDEILNLIKQYREKGDKSSV